MTLFLFTLGPVQTFISQARKAHDLHSGSRLLSKMCRVAAEAFETEGRKVIFPIIEKDEAMAEKSSNPNRFLGIVSDEKDLDLIGKAVEKAVRVYWKNLFDLPQKGNPKSLRSLLDEKTQEAADLQIENHLDIQWLFQPIENDDYQAAYKKINQRLNALKNTRPFNVFEETGRKCSLDGERNVIFYRKSDGQKIMVDGSPLYSMTNEVFETSDLSKLKLRHLQPGEGLSAVSMLKRNLEFKEGDFPSTAEFALANSMREIRKTSAGEAAFQEMKQLLKPDLLNWQVFFEENLTANYFKKQGIKASHEDAKKVFDKLKTAADGLNPIRRFDKYYALLLFDGDHMGEWWSGDRLKKEHKPNLKEFHEKLAQKLADFAKAVRAEFEKDKHRGWVVYAGGDDFLGFFNLHHLAASINFLKSEYKRIVHDELKDHFDEPNKLTFSAGICIAHYKEPLSLVLSEARELEKKAKKLDEKTKDAFGIGVIPGSGQIARATFAFEDFGSFKKVMTDLKSGDFSNAFVSKARAELADFKNEKGELPKDWNEPSKRLIERAIGRACNLKKEEGESDETFKKRKEAQITELSKAVGNLLCKSKNLQNFFDALDIADFIERQTKTPKKQPAAHETAN